MLLVNQTSTKYTSYNYFVKVVVLQGSVVFFLLSMRTWITLPRYNVVVNYTIELIMRIITKTTLKQGKAQGEPMLVTTSHFTVWIPCCSIHRMST
ncbi:hypothetical protein WH47_12404 [Habropoda laboriosa]|uniref:Uncharacterized protein n=1 Tax=Habropoda laboriosa TaxID=597456 RepID=A0A0L7R7W6_9HYME|nr:hypothetical protein WH47_12404 [Habropoda laboriosa]